MVHEWALAEAIVEYAVKVLNVSSVKRGLKIKIGLLQSIDLEVLGFAVKHLLKERGLGELKVVYETVDPLLKCNKCGFEWRIRMSDLEESIREAVHFVPEVIQVFTKCPNCSSQDFSIISGRGVESIETLD